MRDLYKLVLLVPVVIVLSIFLLKFQDVGGNIDITSIDGSITVDHQGEDFDLSAPGRLPLQFSDMVLAPNPPSPTLTITHDPTIDVDLTMLGGDSAQYHFEVDVPALQTAVGAAVTTQIWDPLRQDPGGVDDPGYVTLDKLRVEAQSPIRLRTAYYDTEDEMRVTFDMDGGVDGQLVTSTGSNSNPAYEDLNLSVEGRTATQLEVASSAAGTNAIIPAATTTEAGLMSAADKALLLPVTTGASAGETVVLEDVGGGVLTPGWDAVTGGGGRNLRTATATLDASDIVGLAAAGGRIELIPEPPAGTYVLPHHMTILKTGGPATPAMIDNTSMWLALTDDSGGLIEATDAIDYYAYSLILAGQGFSGGTGWLRAGHYEDSKTFFSGLGFGLGRFSGGAQAANIWTGSPLTIIGYAQPVTVDDPGTPDDDRRTAQQQWTAATAGLSDISIRIIISYEIVDPTGIPVPNPSTISGVASLSAVPDRGVDLSGSTGNVTIGLMDCGDDEVLAFDTTDGWECAEDKATTLVNRATTISGAQIKALDTSRIELVPAPSAVQYIVVDEMWIAKGGTDSTHATVSECNNSSTAPDAGCIPDWYGIGAVIVDDDSDYSATSEVLCNHGRYASLSWKDSSSFLRSGSYGEGAKIGGHSTFLGKPLELALYRGALSYESSVNRCGRYSQTAYDTFVATIDDATMWIITVSYRVATPITAP